MPSSAPDRGHSPIPGETSLALVTMSVFLGVAVVGAIAALICSAFIEDLEPTGKAVAALLSDMFVGTTGEIIHVDGGYHAMGA